MRDVDEEARLSALYSYGVLDTPRPKPLDELTQLGSSVFDTTMSTVTLVDRDRQWFAGRTGLTSDETPRSMSFCAETIPTRTTLVVSDARADAHFRDYPNVTGEPHIRFYAGAPLIDDDGFVLGTFCVKDDRPGDLGPRQQEALETLARQAGGHLSLMRSRLMLAELGDELARATQREEDLVATISHELRTPVTAIQGYLELLAEDEGLAGYDRLVEPIYRNGQRLVGMVDHLLTGTRPVDAPLLLHRSPAELHLVLNAAVQANAALAEPRGVEVAVERPTEASVVSVDIARITQAVQQLVRNAILFTPAGGKVTLRVVYAPVPAIEVSDTGVGIPADELPYVFQRFFRGRHARRQAVPGVGLGLHIAQEAVAAHGGRITLSSAGNGTTARLTLP
ncbi:GAF domain-containing sensor histidine kinase [Dactylosporangium matsuzakiense]|uniref:histidine kinase n=1 Tax=Dactylosporangium matsuzakiense TaxID=53360 RepID=A0A9W6KVD2_9ACTN|nr:GAF domain-containing sensor histidine kinase [Dactylosporangium matsuzakiense]UWZ41752.1 GAF domain-containing sensor histidine kinase [Dactylosporangium matsuzakiense]GLL08348.1 sensor histidine kinase [Dactylosporangium matsuzakiense]